jgi:hypothetical protein
MSLQKKQRLISIFMSDPHRERIPTAISPISIRLKAIGRKTGRFEVPWGRSRWKGELWRERKPVSLEIKAHAFRREDPKPEHPIDAMRITSKRGVRNESFDTPKSGVPGLDRG